MSMGSGLQAMVIGAVAMLGSLAVWKMAGPPTRLQPDEVELATVLNEWNGEVLWVDARSRAEWQGNGVGGSVLITLDPAEDFDGLIAEALPKLVSHSRLVVYCSEPGCGSSRQVVQRLEAADLGLKCFALHGGVQKLIEAGLVSGSR